MGSIVGCFNCCDKNVNECSAGRLIALYSKPFRCSSDLSRTNLTNCVKVNEMVSNFAADNRAASSSDLK